MASARQAGFIELGARGIAAQNRSKGLTGACFVQGHQLPSAEGPPRHPRSLRRTGNFPRRAQHQRLCDVKIREAAIAFAQVVLAHTPACTDQDEAIRKIREAQLEKIPYMLVVGDKEQSAGTVTVRDRVDGDQGAIAVAELIKRLTEEVNEKRIRQVSTGTAGLSDSGAKFAD